MNKMLPAVHMIAVVSAFDHGLEEFINSNAIEWPRKLPRTLNNRIDVLAQSFDEKITARLHEVRKWRNKVGHIEAGKALEFITWDMLKEAIDHMFDAFLVLGYFSEKPVFEGKYQRIPELFLDAPGPSGERVRHMHLLQVLLNGEPFLETESNINYGSAQSEQADRKIG
ncbi:MAG: hypothetical protein IPH06_02685 [Alphaproteobacteria bacterium]|nr:hypothetical protein [Alphaproteobacteria bacterium]QQS56951.1 MAG: hypothetical protein IPN28_11940 [Alphaproteobacteria bacterium]